MRSLRPSWSVVACEQSTSRYAVGVGSCTVHFRTGLKQAVFKPKHGVNFTHKDICSQYPTVSELQAWALWELRAMVEK